MSGELLPVLCPMPEARPRYNQASSRFSLLCWLHLMTYPACYEQWWQEARLKLPCHKPEKPFRMLM